MSILNNSFLSVERVKRSVPLWFGIGLVTILCHTGNREHKNAETQTGRSASGVVYASAPSLLEFFLAFKKPKAHDDNVNTFEDTPVRFNVLLNDEGEEEDDDGVPIPINPITIDLNPETDAIEKNIETESGNFAVDLLGEVNYEPATDFSGEGRIEYTVNNLLGELSNKAKIRVTVTSLNDPPTITGQTSDPIPTNEDVPLTIDFSHLVVSDPDSSYPTGFTISVGTGSNYTVSGTQITPVSNYSGVLSVPVTVNDGTASSNEFILNVVVNAVNDAPVITAQTPDPLTASEDTPFAIALSNLSVSDPDNSYPTGFALQIQNGTNYTVSGTTVTPAANFSGLLSIPVTVNDGSANSNSFEVKVNVAPINDAPVITAQTPDPLVTNEDQALPIQLTNLIVTDPDNTYPAGFSIQVADGDNYSVSGNTITPDADFTGPLLVNVTVNDGTLTSNVFAVEVSVNGTNDVPEITGQNTIATDEDNAVTVTLAHLLVVDSDNSFPTGFTLTLGAGSNYTLSGNTVIPVANFSGSLSVPATVNDGESNSNTFALTITVNPVNDVPVITGQGTLTTAENTPLALNLGNFTVADVDNAYPTGFTLTVVGGTNYSVSGTTITPASGFSGTLTVGVQVNDGASLSDVFNATVGVTAVNDPPVITGSNALTLAEDNALTLQLADLIVTDADNTYPVGFSLTVLPGTNYTPTGNTITPSANFNGSLSVGVQVNDGTSSSNVYQVPITVSAVNDAPVITGQNAVSVAEDQSVVIDLSKLLVTDPDNSFPTGFSLTLFTGLNYTFTGGTITPSPDFRGTLSVPVQVSDGSLTSNIFQLQITVSDVNDAPVITGQTPVSTNEDTPVAIGLSNLTVFDPDNAYPAGFTLAIAPGTNYTVSGNTITPALDFNGTLNIAVTVNDGASASAPFNFQVQVGNSNDPPVIIAQAVLSTNEETPIALALNNLTVTDPDNPFPTGFTLSVSAGENYTFAGTTVTPAPNFVGALTVPVRVNDGVNNSPTFNLSIQVNAVNDPPAFSAISNQIILENGKPLAIAITGVTKGPGEDAQVLSFAATSSNTSIIPNPSIAYNGGSTAQLTYTLVPNANGVVTITVTATDNGPANAPNQNTYSSTFQITVSEINNAPTLDNISNVTMLEDAALTTINLTGITAGAGETQNIAIEVNTDKPALFETLSLAYTSPQNTATISLKPSANSAGVATITVKVSDNGSNAAPSVNFVSKTFTVSIQSVNDAPVFVSIPVGVAAVGEPYEYLIQFTDVETPNLVLTAVSKPSWATLTSMANGKFRLSGTPPPSAQGESLVDLQVKDADQTGSQQFKLVVNNRPLSKPVAVSVVEDNPFTFSAANFTPSYSDIDQHALKLIQVTQLPPNGKLLLGDGVIKANDTIDLANIGQLQYQPNPNYDKPDVFFWKAFDGYHFSAIAAAVDIAVQPVNDAPVITVAQDTLQFDVNGIPALVTDIFTIEDPDDDSLSRAEIVITQNFDLQYDQLIVQPSGNIRGIYEPEFGRIVLTGLASREEYVNVIRNIQYNYLNTIDPVLKMKSVTYTANDGKTPSQPVVRLIDLKYTFIELEIPGGFTPNGDLANDEWVITRPGGLDQLTEAFIRVVNSRGVTVFETKGFDQSWDGTVNGQELPAGSYFFTIDLNLRSKKTYRGVVTILR